MKSKSIKSSNDDTNIKSEKVAKVDKKKVLVKKTVDNNTKLAGDKKNDKP